jgi:NAD(P)-dependent dehydrogenase (short-subunit alcohol dehydrogenase family)
MNMNFSNKHAVITGGSNGIGRCIAETFLREGATVTIIDRRAAGGNLAESKKFCFFEGDIGDKSTLERFVDTLSQPVNFLINNACVGRGGLLSDCTYEDFEYVQRVGVTAPYYLTSLLLQKKLFNENAAIVNISSTRTFQSQPDSEAYSAVKGGIVALTHSMAVSLAGKVRVNCISPGWIETSATPEHSEQDKHQHPSGRVGRMSDIAEMVLYLCSDKAGFINGENITIDGGMTKQMIYHGDCGWKLKK